MEIILRPSWMLSNEHPAYSHGQPVLVSRLTGEAYRPGNVVQPYSLWGWMTARVAVFRMVKSLQLDHVERAFVSKFGMSRQENLKRIAMKDGYRKSEYKLSSQKT